LFTAFRRRASTSEKHFQHTPSSRAEASRNDQMPSSPLILVDLIKNLRSENPVGKTAAIRKKSADSNNTKVNQIQIATQFQTSSPFLLSFHFLLASLVPQFP
jgi:hypothetical protein